MAVAVEETKTIELVAPDLRVVEITLKGLSPLIMHRWSEKAKKEMLNKQTKTPSVGRAAKDPKKDYEESLYIDPEDPKGYVFPTIAFKAAAVRAGTYAEQKMTFLRGAFHIVGDWAKIKGEPQPREDMVRISMGKADIRYRAEFPKWSTTLSVRYNARAITLEQVVNLFAIAGFSVGIGEWRPEKDGSFGTFQVESVKG